MGLLLFYKCTLPASLSKLPCDVTEHQPNIRLGFAPGPHPPPTSGGSAVGGGGVHAPTWRLAQGTRHPPLRDSRSGWPHQGRGNCFRAGMANGADSYCDLCNCLPEQLLDFRGDTKRAGGFMRSTRTAGWAWCHPVWGLGGVSAGWSHASHLYSSQNPGPSR